MPLAQGRSAACRARTATLARRACVRAFVASVALLLPAVATAEEPAAVALTEVVVPSLHPQLLSPSGAENFRTYAPPPLAGTRSSAGTPGQPVTPANLHPRPTNHLDLSAWLQYKTQNHIEALPYQARLFYRRGLEQRLAGNSDEALRLIHGATELDGRFITPHLTLASWLLTKNTSQSLQHYAIVLDLARRNFVVQLAMLGNAVYLLLQAIVLGLLITGLMILWHHRGELHHAWQERLGRVLSQRTARWWSWGLLVLPFLIGFGPILPTVALLGLLWPMLRKSERAVFLALALFLGTSPLLLRSLDHLAEPLREERAPFYGIATIEAEPYRADVNDRLQRLAAENPENPFVQFAYGWTARRGGDLEAAERAYRTTLTLWQNDDRTLNNLGNVLASSGRPDAALEAYDAALAIQPANAYAHFNRSQILTQSYDFKGATDALSRASAIDFDMVKALQAQQTADGFLPLADQWIAPAAFWDVMSQTVTTTSDGTPSVPPNWRTRIEFSGTPFSILAIVVAILSLSLGIMTNKRITLRSCSNCGRVVCRRCASRRRELALCPVCADVEARAESPEFARVLLAQHRRKLEHGGRLLRTSIATLVPGYGLLSMRRLFACFIVVTFAALLATPWLGLAPPFLYESGPVLPESGMPVPVVVAAWVLMYASSLLGYVALVARADAQARSLAAPVKSRVQTVTRVQKAEAA